MEPDTARLSGNGGNLGRLQEMVAPVRDRLEDAARDLSEVLAKAAESVKKIRTEDVAELMRRSPLTVLGLAVGLGFIVGLILGPRER